MKRAILLFTRYWIWDDAYHIVLLDKFDQRIDRFPLLRLPLLLFAPPDELGPHRQVQYTLQREVNRQKAEYYPALQAVPYGGRRRG
jgi:hypothetical protein